MDRSLGVEKNKRGGGWGRRSSNSAPDRRLADDGKRNEVYGMEWTVHFEYNIIRRGGGPGEEGLGIALDRRAVGF